MCVKVCFVVGLISVLSFITNTRATTYRLTSLGDLGGGESRALGISNSGDIAGWAHTGFEEIHHAYRYSNETMYHLNPNDTEPHEAYGINARGEIVGRVSTSDYRIHAGVWRDNILTDIDPDGTRSSANSINENGSITGDVDINGVQRVFRYSAGVLSPIHSGTILRSSGKAINNHETIAGYSEITLGQRHAFTYSASGETNDLGTLGGQESVAQGINDRDDVIGWSHTETGIQEAFVYYGDDMQSLGSLDGHSSAANDINNMRQIVGWYSPDNYDRRAFVTVADQMVDLNLLLEPNTPWLLVEATAINELGQIVGFGIDPDGMDRAFLLTPIPTPASFLLVTALLSALRRRK